MLDWSWIFLVLWWDKSVFTIDFGYLRCFFYGFFAWIYIKLVRLMSSQAVSIAIAAYNCKSDLWDVRIYLDTEEYHVPSLAEGHHSFLLQLQGTRSKKLFIKKKRQRIIVWIVSTGLSDSGFHVSPFLKAHNSSGLGTNSFLYTTTCLSTSSSPKEKAERPAISAISWLQWNKRCKHILE